MSRLVGLTAGRVGVLKVLLPMTRTTHTHIASYILMAGIQQVCVNEEGAISMVPHIYASDGRFIGSCCGILGRWDLSCPSLRNR